MLAFNCRPKCFTNEKNCFLIIQLRSLNQGAQSCLKLVFFKRYHGLEWFPKDTIVFRCSSDNTVFPYWYVNFDNYSVRKH